MSETTAEATAVKVRDAILNAIRVQQIPAGDWITVILTDNPENDPGTTRTWLYRGSINRRQFDGSIQEHPIMVSGRAAGILNQVAISEFKTVFPDWEESTNLENRPGADVDGYAAVPELQGLTFEMWWRDEPLEKIAEAMRLQGLDSVSYTHLTLPTKA